MRRLTCLIGSPKRQLMHFTDQHYGCCKSLHNAQRGGKKPVYKYSSKAKPSPPPSLSPHTWGRRLGCICGRKHQVESVNINTSLESCNEVSHNIQRTSTPFLLNVTFKRTESHKKARDSTCSQRRALLLAGSLVWQRSQCGDLRWPSQLKRQQTLLPANRPPVCKPAEQSRLTFSIAVGIDGMIREANFVPLSRGVDDKVYGDKFGIFNHRICTFGWWRKQGTGGENLPLFKLNRKLDMYLS